MVKPSLHAAVLANQMDEVMLCLSTGADPDEPYWEGDGKAPLLLAAGAESVDVLRLLCEHGCNPNVRSVRGETALHLAITSKKQVYEKVRLLVGAGCDPNIQENVQGQIPLHLLVKHLLSWEDFSDEALDTLKLLIDSCNPASWDHRQRTALHRAAVGSASTSCIQLLLACNPNLQNIRGETALVEALESDCQPDIVPLLAAHTDLSLVTSYRETALHVAARKGRDKVVDLLVSMNAPVNAKDLKGNTPLHLAAERGYLTIVNRLRQEPEIELNAQNNEGLTPLHVAVESGFLPVVEVLLNVESIDINVKTKRSETALDLAQQDYRRRSHPQLGHLIYTEMQKRQAQRLI